MTKDQYERLKPARETISTFIKAQFVPHGSRPMLELIESVSRDIFKHGPTRFNCSECVKELLLRINRTIEQYEKDLPTAEAVKQELQVNAKQTFPKHNTHAKPNPHQRTA
jgi:hypothetical protein